MCESTVILKKNGEEVEVMSEVVYLKVNGSIITMSNLLGDKKTVKGNIDSIDFMGHKLLLQSI